MDFSNIENILINLASGYTFSNKKYFSVVDKKSYSIDEAVDKVFAAFTSTYPTDYQPYMSQVELLKQHIGGILKNIAKAKKDKQTKTAVSRSIVGQEASSLSAKLVTNPLWQPTDTFNSIDASWCSGLILDNRNTLYKRKEDGSLEVLDSLTKANLANCVNAVVRVQDIPKPVEYCRNRMAVLTLLAKEIDATRPLGIDGLFSVLHKDYGTLLHKEAIGKTLMQFLNIAESELDEIKDTESLISKLVYHVLDNQLPASSMYGFTSIAKIYNVYKDEDGKDHETFDGFKVSTRGNAPFTKSSYFEKVLDEEQEYLEHIPHRPIPVTMRDDNGNVMNAAFGVFNEELMEEDKKKYGNLKYEDSYITKEFLEPLNKEQKKFTLAWYYAMFYSFKLGPVIISKLHQDGGGTLKTTVKNYYRYGMKRYFGTDVTFALKRGELLKEQNLFDSNRKMSLADCAYCMYDEPNQKGELWEAVKGMTGNPTVEMMVKQLYVNPFSAESSVVFDFGSNKPIYLSDKTAYDRRLAIIRTAASNTYKNVPKAELDQLAKVHDGELNERQLEEFHLLLRLGKACYKEIIDEYGSLTEAATSMYTIARELEDTNPWNEAYSEFYSSLFDDDPTVGTAEKPLKIASKTLAEKLAVFSSRNRQITFKLDELGLQNYLRKANLNNECGKVYDNKTRKTVRGWRLYKQVEKNDSNFLFTTDCLTEIGLREDGSIIPSAPDSPLVTGGRTRADYAEMNRQQRRDEIKRLDEQDFKDMPELPDITGEF